VIWNSLIQKGHRPGYCWAQEKNFNNVINVKERTVRFVRLHSGNLQRSNRTPRSRLQLPDDFAETQTLETMTNVYNTYPTAQTVHSIDHVTHFRYVLSNSDFHEFCVDCHVLWYERRAVTGVFHCARGPVSEWFSRFLNEVMRTKARILANVCENMRL
jgi:hypothetical protein